MKYTIAMINGNVSDRDDGDFCRFNPYLWCLFVVAMWDNPIVNNKIEFNVMAMVEIDFSALRFIWPVDMFSTRFSDSPKTCKCADHPAGKRYTGEIKDHSDPYYKIKKWKH